MEALRVKHDVEIKHHEEEIRRHKEAIKRHRAQKDDLNKANNNKK